MLEMICSIPENVGWVIVGVVGTLTTLMAIKVGKIIIQAIKDRLIDDEEIEKGA